MNTFIDRIKLNWDGLEALQQTELYKMIPDHFKISYNCGYLKDLREGKYLIKAARNGPYYCGEKNLYIGFTYKGDWFTFMKRRDAQWFSGKEAQDFIRTYKGFTIVKR